MLYVNKEQTPNMEPFVWIKQKEYCTCKTITEYNYVDKMYHCTIIY